MEKNSYQIYDEKLYALLNNCIIEVREPLEKWHEELTPEEKEATKFGYQDTLETLKELTVKIGSLMSDILVCKINSK